MNALLIIASIFAFLFIALKVRSGMNRQKQILNIVYGKYTFDRLTEKEKMQVVTVTLDILHRGGIRAEDTKEKLEQFDDLQKYGVNALAMAELGISPAGGKYTWQYVRNPIIIPEKIHKELGVAVELFYKDYNVRLDLKR